MRNDKSKAFSRPHDPSDPWLLFAAEAYARAAREGLAHDEQQLLRQVAAELDMPEPALAALLAAGRLYECPPALVPVSRHGGAAGRLSVRDLRTEGLVDPLGLGETNPIFTAHARPVIAGAVCKSFRILAASAPDLAEPGRADLWDSGVIEGAAIRTAYRGVALASRKRCWWRVLAAAHGDQSVCASALGFFEMGLLDPGKEFTPQWIGLDYPRPVREQHDPAPHLRLVFAAKGPATRARLYVSALGLYRIWLNGMEATQSALFRPGWTDYHKRIQIQTYDVTAAVEPGRNVLHAVLGKGWYAGHAGFMGVRGVYGPKPALAALLVLEFPDGSSERIETSGAWEGQFGAIQTSDMLTGEVYDARQAIDPVAATGGWLPVQVHVPPAARLAMQTGPSQRRALVFPAQRSEKLGTLTSWFVLDFGQNISGRTRLTVRNAKPGTEIILRHGEALNPEGGVYTANLRRAFAEDRYICRGDPLETYEGSFTIHGFRYVEVWNMPQPLLADSVLAVVIDHDAELAGHFLCGSDQINALQSAIQWTARDNFLEVQMDCPQRNERCGWLGDAHAFAQTAAANFDYSAFYRKWMLDILDARTQEGDFTDVAPNIAFPYVGAPGWADFGAILPAFLLDQYDDVRTAGAAFEAGLLWLDRIDAANPDGVRVNAVGNNYGDWLSQPKEAVLSDEPGAANKFGTAPHQVVGTAMSVRVAQALAQIALRLGRPEAARLAERAAVLQAAYVRAFVKPDGSIEGDTQSIYAQAIGFGLLPPEIAAAAHARLAERVEEVGVRPLTGLMGISHLLPALARAGREDLAVSLLLQSAWPSWGFMLANGATTLWERWDGWTPQKGFQESRLNSFNHVALGSIGAYLFDHLAGIRAHFDSKGTAHVAIVPHPDRRLGWVKAVRRTPCGPIAVHWRYADDHDLHIALDVGGIANALLRLEARAFADATMLDASGRWVRAPREIILPSGAATLRFTVP
jgi:alpha-L-rhamnosidase